MTHGPGHGHAHGHAHETHGHEHETRGRSGKIGAAIREIFTPHSHDAAASIDGVYAATDPDGRVIALLADKAPKTTSVVVIRPATLAGPAS
jgi:hypothetical protein